MIDVLTALQVAKSTALSPTDVVTAMRAVGQKAAVPPESRSRPHPGARV